jgi:hypothetical protein
MKEIEDGEFDTHCRHINESQAREWVGKAVDIARMK